MTGLGPTGWQLVLPIILPFFVAVACYAARFNREVGRWISALGMGALLFVTGRLLISVWTLGPVAAQMGDWPAPFGITLVADGLAAAMAFITAITGLATVVFSMADIDARRERHGYHAFLHILVGGVCGAFLTGDIFNLYVWFEVMLIASFALLTLGGEKVQLDGAIKYVALNLISTLFFLSAIGLLYGLTGTLNMADLHLKVQLVENQGALTAVAVLFLFAFGIKSAVFPLFFWLPASYHTPPVAVSAIFSGLLTKVGVYALIRVFTLIFTGDVGYTHEAMLWVAGFTMITGVLGAAAQDEFRKILSFHIVSQIGYMIMGLALFTPLGLLGSVFYIVHHIIVKANLFFVAGIANRIAGSYELAKLGGLYKHYPLIAVLFLIPAFSLAGFPPLSGFWAKLILIDAALKVEAWWIAAAALATGVLTVFSMTKIWAEVFWKREPEPYPMPAGSVGAARVSPLTRAEWGFLVTPVAGLAALTLLIGLFPEPFYAFAEAAAHQLMDPRAYVAAVLGPDALATGGAP